MGDLSQAIGGLIFQQLQSLIIQTSPMIITGVIGAFTYQASTLMQKYKRQKDVELAATELKALEQSALTLVTSLYEKSSVAAKAGIAEKGIPAKVRKEMVVEQLKQLYPKISEQFIDAVVDSVVFAVKPSKPAKKKES
jgi:hypothetical protein